MVFKCAGKVLNVIFIITYKSCNIAYFKTLITDKQFFCLFHPYLKQILGKRNSCHLFKHTAKITVIQIIIIADNCQSNIFTVVFIDILNCGLDNILVILVVFNIVLNQKNILFKVGKNLDDIIEHN